MPSAPSQSPPLREKVQTVINLIRPAVQADGGDIELVNVLDDGVVQIRFHGACHGCPSSTMTLQMGIERNLREKVPEVTGSCSRRSELFPSLVRALCSIRAGVRICGREFHSSGFFQLRTSVYPSNT